MACRFQHPGVIKLRKGITAPGLLIDLPVQGFGFFIISGSPVKFRQGVVNLGIAVSAGIVFFIKKYGRIYIPFSDGILSKFQQLPGGKFLHVGHLGIALAKD